MKVKYVEVPGNPEDEVYICDDCATHRIHANQLAYFNINDDELANYDEFLCGFCLQPATLLA